MTQYIPRGDIVLFRVVDRGKVGRVHIPQISKQGKERIVEAVGPDVVGLSVGERVMVIGTVGQDVVELPNEQGLFITKQSNVVLIIKDVEDQPDAGT